MSVLSKELDKLKYDKRLTDWHVSRGKFPKEDLKKYLDALPDLSSNVDHFGLGDERESRELRESAAAQAAPQTPASTNGLNG